MLPISSGSARISPPPNLLRPFGAALALVSGVLALAVLLAPEAVARRLPAFQEVGLNTMLAFALGGMALWWHALPRRLSLLGTLVCLLALTVLLQALTDLYPAPGPWRLVLNTSVGEGWLGQMSLGGALAFLAWGCALILLPRARRGASLLAIHALLGGVFLVALLGLMGHAMGFSEFSLDVLRKTLMGIPTALGLMSLSMGLYLLASRSEGLASYFERYPDRRILSIAMFVLLVLLLLAGLASSAIVGNHALRVFQHVLIDSLRTNSILFEQSVKNAENLGQISLTLAARDATPDWRYAYLGRAGVESVSAVWREGKGGARQVLFGTPAVGPVYDIPLENGSNSHLLWRDGWLVQTRLDDRVVQVRMASLERLFHYDASLGTTADISIGAALGPQLQFLYTRLINRPFTHPSHLDRDGKPLPMTLAVRGQRGTVFARDYRGLDVVAAYAPVLDGRIGMVQKVDAGEMFQALQAEFWKIVLLLLGLATGGALLLYHYVLPLAQRLRQTQTNLADSLHRNELILQCAGEGIYGFDRAGRATFVNAAAERLLGYTLADLGQTTVHAVIHHSRRDGSAYPPEACPIFATLSDGQPHHDDGEVFWCKDGRPLDVEYVSAPILEDGQVIGAVVVFSDITARRRGEATLREHEAHLARAQAQGKLGSWWLDVPNDALEWSAECYRIFAMPLGTPLNYQAFLARVHADDRAYVDRAWRAAMAGEPYDIQHRIVAAGQIRWVRERADLEFAPDGTLLRGIGTAQDITELKHHEDELLRSRQSLRELAAHHEKIREEERSRIAREIHDELGQYLTALRMDTAMLNIRFGQDNPVLQGIIADMKQTIDTTIGVVRNIASALRPGALDMGLVSAAEWLLAGFQERTGIRCRLSAPAEDLGLDNERATAAFRILQESLTNVARYAKAGAVDVQIELVDAALEMVVRDDGIGFDPLEVRGRKTFGLMGIRERALMFGGESRIDSEPGAGTTLRVRIPLSTKGLR